MNKRSAAIVAAGLVAVLSLGGFAYSRGLTGPGVSAATAGGRGSHPKPIVRTHTKRLVTHRSAPAPAPRIVYSQASNAAPVPAMSGDQGQSGSDDDAYEDDAYEDDHDEQEDEDEEDQQDDHEGEDEQEDHEEGGEDD